MFLSFASNTGTVSAEIQMDITYLKYETHLRSTLRQADFLISHKFPVSSGHASRMTSRRNTLY
jgi:hypothetical protein